MFFEYLKLDRDDFKDFLISKKFEVMEMPLLDDYFSFENKSERGHIFSVNGMIYKLIGFVFTNFKKAQLTDLVSCFDKLYAVVDTNVAFENGTAKNTLTFVFQDNKVSIIIKDIFHAVIDDSDFFNFRLFGIDFNFQKSLKFGQFISLIENKTEDYFKMNYQLEYTKENLLNVRREIHNKYNLNAPNYRAYINQNYTQTKIANYMDEHYASIMLSSVINHMTSLSILVLEPTIDMSRKVNHDGKSYGIERVTFPVSSLNKTEKLLDHILMNDWSRKTLQIVNAMILYQSAMNNLTVKHISLIPPNIQSEKHSLEDFELLTVMADSDIYFDNRQSFKIIFGLNIKIQVKDGTSIVYDETFKNLDEAYVHFIDYFKKRIIKIIPDKLITNDTLKLLNMINF